MQTTDYRHLFDLVSDLLQRLQILRTNQQRIVLQQLYRVGPRTRRGRLLTAADQIGLRLLLRRREFIQNVANVAYICRGTVP